MRRLLALLVAAAGLTAIVATGFTGCGPPTMKLPKTLDRAALLKPESCMTCHPDHYTQWSTSMHAYAAEDPVFVAMNARGQRETSGALGSFCVNCHAPMAVREGQTTDGTNLASVPSELHGVTCFFCHSVSAVTADHDDPLTLATDLVLRAGISDPFDNTAHDSAYSDLHDRQAKTSASMCGSCHDVVTPNGTAIERTYQEWQSTIYATDTPATLRTCGKCHMSGTEGVAAPTITGAPMRLLHDHTFDGIDLALTDFPGVNAQKGAINRDLTTAASAKLCVTPGQTDTELTLTLDNVAVGHGFPSGANQDRRAWIEIVATSAGQPVYESGVIPDGGAVGAVPDGGVAGTSDGGITTTSADPDLWLLRDEMYDANGKPVSMFWQASSYKSVELPPSVTNDPNDPRYVHTVTRTYHVTGRIPDTVTMRVHIQAIGLDVIDDLVASGDLDATYRDKIPTFDLEGIELTWSMATNGFGCVP